MFAQLDLMMLEFLNILKPKYINRSNYYSVVLETTERTIEKVEYSNKILKIISTEFKLNNRSLIHIDLTHSTIDGYSAIVTCSYVSNTGFHFDLFRLMRHVPICGLYTVLLRKTVFYLIINNKPKATKKNFNNTNPNIILRFDQSQYLSILI
ncbi:hypothetical protein BpHYR1_043104 [Brachionus plicatilis]|uniref:Uncharacterized protein n=1 Tax=Brachionus plicatilis TaxID=10195 RepID=A0A3M7T2F4_BRAPC|nr:hypothetical protein BpHYR1_043104 [Brachionus plicatilis]